MPSPQVMVTVCGWDDPGSLNDADRTSESPSLIVDGSIKTRPVSLASHDLFRARILERASVIAESVQQPTVTVVSDPPSGPEEKRPSK